MRTPHTTFKLFLASVILIAGFQLNAQDRRQHERSAEDISDRQTEFFAEKLELDDEQTQQLKSINLKYANQVKELREKERSRSTREELEKLKHSHNAEVKTILDDEDFGEYLVLKEKMHERMRMQMRERRIEAQYKVHQNKRERMHERRAFMEKLDLDDEQRLALKAIKESYSQKHEAIRAEGRSKETYQKLEALQKEQNKEVKKVLDKDQYKLFLEMQEMRKQNMKKRKRPGN